MRIKRKIWIDALTPKQALFTKAMRERAPANVELLVTTRNYSELNQFTRQIKLKNIPFGKHGGGLIQNKLKASIERMLALAPFVSKNDFDCSLSFISPEAARVSFGLGLKHFVCSDSPHAAAPSRLAVPLATKLFTPFPIPKERWTQYGIDSSQVSAYHALDPWAWLLSRDRPEERNGHESSVLIRLEESYASYLKSGKGITSLLSELIRKIKSIGDFEISIIPRYDEQRSWARKKFGRICIVPESTVDGAELISRACLVIGGGGTMTQEAAILGVPNISYFPSAKLDVFENYYFPKKLSTRASTPSELIKQTSRLLTNNEDARSQFSSRAKRAISTFEDPVKFLFHEILKD